jgi:hypothetical protein
MINYCYDELCQNSGVCRPVLGNYSCECLGGSYSGRHCETKEKRIIIIQAASKSLSFIAIIAILCVAMLIIIMDILHYCFGIDPVKKERKQIRKEKHVKRQKSIGERALKTWDGDDVIKATL